MKAEYVKLNQSERITINFNKALYLFWFLGFMFCFSIFWIAININNKNWLWVLFWIVNALFFLPPSSRKGIHKIIKSYEVLLK